MEAFPENFCYKYLNENLKKKSVEAQNQLLKESRQEFYDKMINEIERNKNGHLRFAMKLNDEMSVENKRTFLNEVRERFHRLECGTKNKTELYDDIRDDLSILSSTHTIYISF